MEEKKVKKTKKPYELESKDVPVTGHEWDGIKEYDNPDPKWLRILFYITLFYALGYWLMYPSWPAQRSSGALNWSAQSELADSQKEIDHRRSVYLGEFMKASFEDIIKDEKLRKFAITGGQSAFANNCAMCHGAGGTGNKGYPNLTAGAWLWGGKFEDILQTLNYGIRSPHDETRQSQMAAFGRDGILTKDQVSMLTDFVLGMHKGENQSDAANKLFQANCASCHGAKGDGNYEFGAPALNDAIWLYGADRDTVYDVIYNGRQGVMPYWKGRLDDATIKQLAIYVHELGGGESCLN